MKVNMSEFPEVRVVGGRAVLDVTEEEVRNSGVAFASFGIGEGETITFPESMEGVQFKKQQVRKDSTAYQMLAPVFRDGKPGWLSLGSLTRQGTGKTLSERITPPGSEVIDDMVKLEDNLARYKALAGKSIIGGEQVDLDTPAFGDDGKPHPTDRVKAKFRVLHYAE